jgi:hypothetical protein
MGCSNSTSQADAAPPPQKRHWRGSAAHTVSTSTSRGNKATAPASDTQSTLPPERSFKARNTSTDAVTNCQGSSNCGKDGVSAEVEGGGVLGPSSAQDSLFEASLALDECNPKLAPELFGPRSPFTETIIVMAPQPHREPSPSAPKTDEAPHAQGESEGAGAPRRQSSAANNWDDVHNPPNSPFAAENPLGIKVSRRSRSASNAGPLSFSPPSSPSKAPNRNLSFGVGVGLEQTSAWSPGRPSSPQPGVPISGVTAGSTAEGSSPRTTDSPRRVSDERRGIEHSTENATRSTLDRTPAASTGWDHATLSPNVQRFQQTRELRLAFTRLHGIAARAPIPRDGLEEQHADQQHFLSYDVLQGFVNESVPHHPSPRSTFLAQNRGAGTSILAPGGDSSIQPVYSTASKPESLQSEKEVQLSDSSLSPDDRNALSFH